MSLAISRLNQFYGESHTLWDVSVEIPKGKVTCLLGRNGMGKTTLLKTVMGLLPARTGSIVFDGGELVGKRAETRACVGIGYVPQGREIFGQLSVEENLRLGLPARRDRQRHIPEHIYEWFPALREMRHRRGGDLSGGQQQQLAIGRALAIDPSLLILDEPTEGIQPNIVAEIGALLVTLSRELGMTVLLVEQKLPFVRKVADGFAILDKGRLAAQGPLDGLSSDLVARHLVV